MRRPVRLALFAIALAGAAVAVWILGGFLWPRPQFENRGAPWIADSPRGEG
jgi:hypothetical protein